MTSTQVGYEFTDSIRHTALIDNVFVSSGSTAFDTVEWQVRTAKIENALDGVVSFLQENVEVPSTWSASATNILAQKYFRGTVGTPEREHSLKQVVDRIVTTITQWGLADNYFNPADAVVFAEELKYILIHQYAAFNSPVWFNIGVKGVPQQASACFILAVDDTMDDILNWYKEEGTIFKGGSGAGVNLSNIRGSRELLKGGGTASGPVSFMRGADASAGTIKSGGKTRRAAKMVVLDVDHPDVRDFIWCKAKEEKKIRSLSASGFDMSLDGEDRVSVQYQNANNSVRLSDEFMQAVAEDGQWNLIARTTGEVIDTVSAKELFNEIAQAAWECADPGVQFSSTINDWHTTPAWGPINASNPCSEYLQIDNSACNLASVNLGKFLDRNGQFQAEKFAHVTRIVIMAQDILAGNADYPTKKIGDNTKALRQLGIGVANLGALLMASGVGYDTDEGRAIASSVVSLLTAVAYNTSTHIAEMSDAYEGFSNPSNASATLGVINRHRIATGHIKNIPVDYRVVQEKAVDVWNDTKERASLYGVRNAQVSVMAPTGTIGFIMDCDTTGIEPEFALVKTKTLVGGGTMKIVNQSIHLALARLGYDRKTSDAIIEHVEKTGTAMDAPGLAKEHLSVFATAVGDNAIEYMGHVKMLAAIQPFVSGGISKTVNMPNACTPEDVANLYMNAWQMGVKAVAIYRDGCKVAQPLATTEAKTTPAIAPVAAPVAMRKKLPKKRNSSTFAFSLGDAEGYVTVGLYPDGTPGELFIKMSKQGSTLAGVMDAFSIAISLGLQYGVPLETFVEKYRNMRFDPQGMTDDPEIRMAGSIMDYIFRRLALEFMSYETRQELNLLSTPERSQMVLGLEELPVMERDLAHQGTGSVDAVSHETKAGITTHRSSYADAPICGRCGIHMRPSGSCYSCESCGVSSGCG